MPRRQLRTPCCRPHPPIATRVRESKQKQSITGRTGKVQETRGVQRGGAAESLPRVVNAYWWSCFAQAQSRCKNSSDSSSSSNSNSVSFHQGGLTEASRQPPWFSSVKDSAPLSRLSSCFTSSGKALATCQQFFPREGRKQGK